MSILVVLVVARMKEYGLCLSKFVRRPLSKRCSIHTILSDAQLMVASALSVAPLTTWDVT